MTDYLLQKESIFEKNSPQFLSFDMIILSKIDISHLFEEDPAKYGLPQNINHIKNSLIHIWHDEKYSFSRSDETLNLVAGRYYIDLPPEETKSHPQNESVDDLRYAVGSFLSIRVDRENLTIATSMYKPHDVFYTIIDGEYIFSDCIGSLLSLRAHYKNETDIDTAYCVSVVAGTYGYGEATIFSQIKRLQAGEIILLSQNKNLNRAFFNVPQRNRSDITATIKENIQRITSSNEHIFLMMSGGLDSGFLFCLMSETDLEFSPIHQEAQRSLRESEFADALKLANELGREFYVVCDSKTSSSFEEESNITTISDLISDKRCFFITGYGGDQVFLQNPQKNICFDAYYSGGFAAVIKTAQDYCWLKKENFYSTICHFLTKLMKINILSNSVICCPDWFKPGIELSYYSKHYLLQDVDTRSAKYSHICSIISACISKRDIVSGHTTHHPFLMQNIIGPLINRPVCDLFTADWDRIILRQELHTKYGKSVAWRRTKRPSSSSVMNEISQQIDYLKNIVSNSFLGNKGMIDIDQLCNKIDNCAAVKLSEDFDYISRFLQIEAEIANYKTG